MVAAACGPGRRDGTVAGRDLVVWLAAAHTWLWPSPPLLVDAAASLPPLGELAATTPDEVLDVLETRLVGARSGGGVGADAAIRAERGAFASCECLVGAARQLRSPLLWLLLAAAAVSAVVGEGLDAMIIGLIVGASVGLGFVNEFRERAAEAMHSEIRHEVAATCGWRGGERRGHSPGAWRHR